MPVDTEALIKHRIQRAKDTIKEAEDDISKNFLHSAENRIYYAIFYSALALGVKYGFSTSKHNQLLGWFNKNFVKSKKIEKEFGDIYRNALENRMESDYEDFKTFSFEEATVDFKNMQRFVDRIEKLLTE
ncbi:MAG: hypothetical protein DAHOPDDO_03413 [Ignavibacteriaceae bacterium]|nr:hypothetical protein [Ignavibacteriaceae bacterium]